MAMGTVKAESQKAEGTKRNKGKGDTKMASNAEKTPKSDANQGLNLVELAPELFQRFFAFFQPGHTAGVVPARIKELARLKIAALNECDT